MGIWTYQDTIRKLNKELESCNKFIRINKPLQVLKEVEIVRGEILNAKTHWQYLNAMEKFRNIDLSN